MTEQTVKELLAAGASLGEASELARRLVALEDTLAALLPRNLNGIANPQLTTDDGTTVQISADTGLAPSLTLDPITGATLTCGTSNVLVDTADGLSVQAAAGIKNSGPYTGPFGFVSSQASSPVGGGFNTQIVIDTTPGTGGAYCWNGTDYTKISGAF